MHLIKGFNKENTKELKKNLVNEDSSVVPLLQRLTKRETIERPQREHRGVQRTIERQQREYKETIERPQRNHRHHRGTTEGPQRDHRGTTEGPLRDH